MKRLIAVVTAGMLLLPLFLGCSFNSNIKTGKDSNSTASPIPTIAATIKPTPAASPTPAATSVTVLKIALYLSDSSSSKVLREEREIKLVSANISIADKAKLVIEELIKSERSGIPKNAKVLSAKLDKDMLTIDFSKEFEMEHSGGSTGISITMASLVLSLTELRDVNSVSFLIDGKVVNEFLGHIEFNKAFKRVEYEYMISK